MTLSYGMTLKLAWETLKRVERGHGEEGERVGTVFGLHGGLFDVSP